MLPGLGAAVSGLDAEQNAMTTLGNNLANESTPGYKSQEAEFASLLSQTANAGTAPNALGTQGGVNALQFGMGAQVGGVSVNQSQGTLTNTGNPLDFAIQGNGYFQVQGTSGTFLTRAGQFSLDAQGNLVDSFNGDIVQGYSAVIAKMNYTLTPPTPAAVSPTMGTTLTGLNIPQEITGGTPPGTYMLSSFSVGQNGIISAVYTNASGNTINQALGQIVLGTVPNPSGLVAVGSNAYQVGADSGAIVAAAPGTNGAGTVIQGSLEGSNVDLSQNMAGLIETNGAYAADAKVVTIGQQMEQELASMVQ